MREQEHGRENIDIKRNQKSPVLKQPEFGKMGKAIGIDLGTTFSVAAFVEKGKAKVIPCSEGGNLIPSVVAFAEDETRFVGKLARAQAIANPWQTITSVKRWMGTEKRIKLNGRIYSPQEISSFILNKVKEEAERFLGHKVEKAVITVPAYFDDNQRQATKEAAFLVRLDVMKIINEPTAAALAYGLHMKKIHHILVWDLGGGTFDVSILELGQGVFEVKAVSGDTHLGGDDWDQRIMDYLADEFQKNHKIDVRKEKTALQRLKEASEKAKIELSHKSMARIRIPFIAKDKDLEHTLSREKLEQLSGDLIEKIMAPTEQALRDAKLKPPQIDRVILVGGSTRMPLIQQRAREFFGKEPYKDINPDEVVAIGAAIQAGILSGEIKKIALVDVTPLSLGIETMGGIFTRVIERNTPVPCTRSQIFTTAQDNQALVDIHVLQGERALAVDNISLGNFTLDNIPLARRGEPQIEVTFHIDTNGILRVSALDLHTENQKHIERVSSGGLSSNQLKKILEETRIHDEADRKKKQKIQVGIQAERMISCTQLFMERHYEKLDKSQMDRIEKAILEVKSALAQGNRRKIEMKTEKLSGLVQAIYKKIERNNSDVKWSFA